MKGFSLVIVGALLTSFLADPSCPLQGLRRGARMFQNLMPTLLTLVVLMSLALYLIAASLVVRLLGEGSRTKGILLVILLGFFNASPLYAAFSKIKQALGPPTLWRQHEVLSKVTTFSCRKDWRK